MNRSLLIPIYALLSLGALVATWSFNIAHFAQGGTLWSFVTDVYANDASSSLTNDILFVCAAIFVFMVVDARKTGVQHVWVYIALSLLIAVSVMVPLYLIARERTVQLSTNDASAG